MSTDRTDQQRLVPLPLAPRTASPVLELTSIHSRIGRGPYGNARYRGNCGGYLIRDMLRYFKPSRVLDPMTGSGTCRDVCRELGIECVSYDFYRGQDAASASSYRGIGEFDFVWLHPPYWRMIRYNDDERCLSNAPSLEAFLDGMGRVLEHCGGVLSSSGKIAVLIGGYSERGSYMPLSQLLTMTAIERGFWPSCTEIIRFQHGNTSSRKVYTSSFIPGLHDVCSVYCLANRIDGDHSSRNSIYKD